MKHTLAFLSLFWALPVAAQSPATKPAPTKLHPDIVAAIEVTRDLTYATYGDRQVQLDRFRPKNATAPLPAIVCIHGGGWFKGDRSSMGNLASALAARGFVTVAISYRLSGEAKFPAAIEDAKAAVRWLRANAKAQGIQPDHIGAIGLSAGGHLAALLATSGDVPELEGEGGNAEQSSRIQACVAMGAQTDLLSDRIAGLSARPDDPFYRTFLGASQADASDVYALASPRDHLDPQDPPILVLTGELDDPSTHADEFRADLAKFGVFTDLVILPDAPHAFLGRQNAFDACVERAATFFAERLRD